MTDIIIDMADVAGGSQPGDRVNIYAPQTRPATVASRVTHGRTWGIDLVDGKGTIMGVDPGPLMVQIVPAGGQHAPYAHQVVVPDQATITLRDLLEETYAYTPPVVNAALDTIRAERDGALNAIDDSFHQSVGKFFPVETARVGMGLIWDGDGFRWSWLDQFKDTYSDDH